MWKAKTGFLVLASIGLIGAQKLAVGILFTQLRLDGDARTHQ